MADLVDGLVGLAPQRLLASVQGGHFQRRGRAVGRMPVRLPPQPAQEARHAVHAGLVPLQRLFGRGGEHREQAHGVGAVLVDHRLRIDAVVLGLGHLLDRADLHRLAVRAQGCAGDAAALVTLHVHLGRVDPVLGPVGVVAVVGLGDDHALGEQVGRRLVAVHQPRIAHQLVEEAEIHQVQDRVLDAADVLVHRQPVVAAAIHGFPGAGRGVARVVPARLHEGVEGVGLALGRAAALRAGGLAPLRVGLDRRMHVARGERIRDVLRQQHRQLVFRHRHRAASGAVDDRDRAAPIALAGHAPVAQAEIDLALSGARGLELRCECVQRGVEIHAVEFAGIDQPAAFGLRAVFLDAAQVVAHHRHRGVDLEHVDRRMPAQRHRHRIVVFLQMRGHFLQRIAGGRIGDHGLDRQAVSLGEFPVALVVRRHRHHRAGAVAHQHEVGDVDRHVLAGDRVLRPLAGGHAALFLRLQFGFGHAALPEVGEEGGQLRIVRCRLQRQRMFAGDADEGDAHQRVRTRGEDRQRLGFAIDRELDFQAFAAADPVALHGLDRLRPARQAVQFVQQFLGVVGDAQEPLRDLALFDQRAGAPAAAVDHLLVGQHGLVDRIPVHHRVLAIGQALAHQPGEHALLVHVVVRRAGGELARPVDGVTQRLELAAHVVDVGVGPLRRRHLVLDRRVLGRQAECIPTHRLQHVVPGHALVAADHVADGVVAHVAHVQRTGRIRQHRQAVVLGLVGSLVDLEGARTVPERLGGGLHGAGIVGRGVFRDDGHCGSRWLRQSRLGYRSAAWGSS